MGEIAGISTLPFPKSQLLSLFAPNNRYEQCSILNKNKSGYNLIVNCSQDIRFTTTLYSDGIILQTVETMRYTMERRQTWYVTLRNTVSSYMRDLIQLYNSIFALFLLVLFSFQAKRPSWPLKAPSSRQNTLSWPDQKVGGNHIIYITDNGW